MKMGGFSYFLEIWECLAQRMYERVTQPKQMNEKGRISEKRKDPAT